MCEYINRLAHPVREEGSSFVPPPVILAKSVQDIDRIRQIAQGAEVWIEGIQNEPYRHVEDLVQIHDRELVILSKIHCMDESTKGECIN